MSLLPSAPATTPAAAVAPPSPSSSLTPSSKSTAPIQPAVIQELSADVVNRIAAGEVIHRPSNALKELLENSLDAHSTRISVTLSDGGLKLLQVHDDGCGIRADDLPIVCRRFTTSKLREFDDLMSLATFGFRGEALASITHVARVTITTMTANDRCAQRATYSDGELTAPPKPCAGVRGTQLTVEDLFYNTPIRRAALKSPTDEYNRCFDVVSKYAIHYSKQCAFTMKKSGAANSDLNTQLTSDSLANIRIVYGNAVARELMPVHHTNEQFHLQVSGHVSNANYNIKRAVTIFFINGRLVDCSLLKRSIDSLYSKYLPKHTHPFVYLSLELPAENIDVNVHPTKREVQFLHEEAIITAIETAIDTLLRSADQSRVFPTQTLTCWFITTNPSCTIYTNFD